MSHTLESQGRRVTPRTALDADDVRTAYRRWAGIYDVVFGGISTIGRNRAVDLINRLPGGRVLEMGVGTGLALPRYLPTKRVTGIDLSAEMLAQAKKRVAEVGLTNVEALHVMDAEATDFEDGAFDIAVAMYVASVVPHPRKLFAEMQRVVRPGGNILFVGHFAAARGPRWWIERAMAPASRILGWHPDFFMEALMPPEDIARCATVPVPPFGIWDLVRLRN